MKRGYHRDMIEVFKLMNGLENINMHKSSNYERSENINMHRLFKSNLKVRRGIIIHCRYKKQCSEKYQRQKTIFYSDK